METLTYNELIQSILQLTQKNIDHFLIGYSFLGQPIYGFHVGTYSGKQIFIDAGIHAREYISTLAIIEEIKYLSNNNSNLNFGAYFIPLVNPDGVRLVFENTQFITNNNLKSFLLKLNNFNHDFSLWKANIVGVDLNVNFNAMWGLGRYNIHHPAPANFIGYYPNSEIENINILKFLSSHNIDGSLSIHSKGEVVYYGYDELSPAEYYRDKFIAEQLSQYLSFMPEKTQESVGGLSDYISCVYHIPALTVELGNNNLSHPITSNMLNTILPNFLGITEKFYSLI